MKIWKFVLPVLLLGLLAAAFMVGQAYAATGCFVDTIGNPFETYICWMKDNAVTSGTGPGTYSPDAFVTRGQMAAFMYRQSNIPPETGDIYFSQGTTDMNPNGNFPNARVTYYTDTTGLKNTVTGTAGFVMKLTVPISLYGRALYIKGVQVCYDADTYSTLTGVYFDHYRTSAGSTAIVAEVIDTTTRTDAACRTYSLTTPSLLTGKDHLSLFITTNTTDTFYYVRLAEVTAILSPSTSAASLEPAPQELPAPAGNPGELPQTQP